MGEDMDPIVALLVIGNGRVDYLTDTIDAAFQHLPPMDHLLMIDDSGDPSVRRHLARTYPDFTIRHHDTNWGMARAVQDGFDAVLATDAEYAVWLEEDFRILRPLPIRVAIDALTTHPHVAQILFQRQPLTPQEHEAGTVVGAMGDVVDHGLFSTQRHIFSLNPCVIPRRLLEYGWPAGPIGVGNETGFTRQLLDDGWHFGVWNTPHLVEHVGETR